MPIVGCHHPTSIAVLVTAACCLLMPAPIAYCQQATPTPELVLADFEDVDQWEGLSLATATTKVGDGSGKWEAMDQHPSVSNGDIPHDWSAYNALALWIYNARKLNETAFMMIVHSESAETEGPDYYSLKLDLSRWEGWRHIVAPFRELGTARSPLGWQQIDSIEFTASGWGNTPNPEAVVYFDDLKLLRLARVDGPRLTDEELFEAIDLDYPGLEKVKAAVHAGDYGAAKAAWLAHLEGRESPRWFVDHRERPRSSRQPPTGGSEGWDYYSYQPVINWTGWRHFSLRKSDFAEARKPIGWDWISYISINAGGWGQTPDPQTVLYLDGIRLVGEDKQVALGEFEQGADGWVGLTPTDEQAKEGARSAKWQNMPTNSSVRLYLEQTDWSQFDALEFWVYSPKATGAKITMVLNSDQTVFSQADEIMKHIIRGHDFGPDMDWEADPNNYREWTYAINRFYHWRTLCEAYWDSRDEKYAREFCDQLVDWVRKNPVPLLNSGNGSYTWRTIECGIRQSTTWPDCLYKVLGSESFTPRVAATMTKSMIEHAQHLMTWPTGGNWLTMESNGLGTIGILLPECKQSPLWRNTAMERMYAELDNQVYPDGAQIELTTGYHQVSLNNFLGLAKTAKLNDIPLPADYYDKLKRMFEYNLYVQMPNARTPSLNDGGASDILSSMQTAYELYEDPVFQWAATRGGQGTAPDHISHFFPYAGQMVMRSGWEPDAAYLVMDAGPYGYGHQHEDKLSIMVHALGKTHIIDPGNYAYDSSPWRRYTIDTPAHNTIMIDGQPQRRRATPRADHVVEEPIPTNVWLTSDRLDYGAGQYDEGYGPGRETKVTHHREVVFVKPDYWLVVDTLTGEGEHLYESVFHFDADEAQVDPDGLTVRTIDPTPNCLIAAAAQEGIRATIIKGQLEPSIQGFIAGQRWRPSWKDPTATAPDHGKREAPAAVFSLTREAPARLLYVIYPHPAGDVPQVRVQDTTDPGAPLVARVTLSDGTTDEIRLAQGAQVVRDGEPWARVSR